MLLDPVRESCELVVEERQPAGEFFQRVAEFLLDDVVVVVVEAASELQLSMEAVLGEVFTQRAGAETRSALNWLIARVRSLLAEW